MKIIDKKTGSEITLLELIDALGIPKNRWFTIYKKMTGQYVVRWGNRVNDRTSEYIDVDRNMYEITDDIVEFWKASFKSCLEENMRKTMKIISS